MGRRAGFTSTSVLNDIVEFANNVALVPVLVGNESLEIVSSSANDANPSGSGARTVTVAYIDNSGNMIESAPITLNGTNAVALGFTAKEILWAEVKTIGSNEVSVGNIRVRIVSGSVEIEQISAGGNRSLSGRFMIPTGYTGYLTSLDVHAINNDQDVRLRAQVDILTRALSSVYHFVKNTYTPANSNSYNPLPFVPIPAGAKVKASTKSAGTAGTVRCDVSFNLILIQN